MDQPCNVDTARADASIRIEKGVGFTDGEGPLPVGQTFLDSPLFSEDDRQASKAVPSGAVCNLILRVRLKNTLRKVEYFGEIRDRLVRLSIQIETPAKVNVGLCKETAELGIPRVLAREFDNAAASFDERCDQFLSGYRNARQGAVFSQLKKP
jgi:hypothetical protein